MLSIKKLFFKKENQDFNKIKMQEENNLLSIKQIFADELNPVVKNQHIGVFGYRGCGKTCLIAHILQNTTFLFKNHLIISRSQSALDSYQSLNLTNTKCTELEHQNFMEYIRDENNQNIKVTNHAGISIQLPQGNSCFIQEDVIHAQELDYINKCLNNNMISDNLRFHLLTFSSCQTVPDELLDSHYFVSYPQFSWLFFRSTQSSDLHTIYEKYHLERFIDYTSFHWIVWCYHGYHMDKRRFIAIHLDSTSTNYRDRIFYYEASYQNE